jgi:large subunit ribosomal protein L29
MATANLAEMTDEQLVHRELELERELVHANFQLSIGELENTAELPRLRKDIARARTAQRSRERSANDPKNTLRNRYRNSFTAALAADAAGGTDDDGGFLKGIANKFGIGS